VDDHPSNTDFNYDTRPGSPNPAAVIGVALIMSIISGALVYYFSGVLLMGQYGPVLLAGLLVSLSLRLIFKGVSMYLAITAMVLALLAAAGGFIMAETKIYTPFMLDMAIRRIFSLHGIIVFGFTGYFGFRISNKRGS